MFQVPQQCAVGILVPGSKPLFLFVGCRTYRDAARDVIARDAGVSFSFSDPVHAPGR
jgi:hypothetical protein